MRAATEHLAEIKVATAEGYAPIPSVSRTGGGAMGIRNVNGTTLTCDDIAIDIVRPAAVKRTYIITAWRMFSGLVLK